jgi:hypothetical protein
MVHKNSYLVPIYLKDRTTNSKENKLLMISSVKINREGYEIALLDDKTDKIASWVRFTYTSGIAFCLGKALGINQDEVRQVNILHAYKIFGWHDDMTFGESGS